MNHLLSLLVEKLNSKNKKAWKISTVCFHHNNYSVTYKENYEH